MAGKKGMQNAGMFKKGSTPNPGGRPKLPPEVVHVRELARQYTEKAVLTLVEILDSNSPTGRVAAANALLDRGWGKSEATTNVNIHRTPKELTTDELVQIISSQGATESQASGGITSGLH